MTRNKSVARPQYAYNAAQPRTNYVVCPSCKAKVPDPWALFHGAHATVRFECETCGLPYTIYRSAVTVYRASVNPLRDPPDPDGDIE